MLAFPAATGFSVGLSLIIAIGAQNAFVLRQGLSRRHVFVVCLICALSDAALIVLGVSGFAKFAGWAPWLPDVMRYVGATFLIWYGARSFRAAMRPSVLSAADHTEQSLRQAVLTCMVFTWLNPHVHLDTVALLGMVSSQYRAATEKIAFTVGATAASFTFFFSLGYGARLLTGLFARPAACRKF